ncbi:FAD:protein FMN transferase [Gulosibacter molinativorax]|uniref:FAD:protein FMN transferase n=1 Tax=Gulosibacter molinativorax TaxID=256821 RepID=A0ABT7C5N4_9MICO|nr:FAD:protein FMN transferase [Gulosibacter molinativorax]MDJ1370489.1 FAD:protein FMN transferase [Gulosibacter molinativorax]QUY62101.1 FAD:protein FMN transferase [Gulosibacter molinativorax]
MGTIIELQVEAESTREILTEAVRRLRVYEHRFSANDPSSELGAINRDAGLRAVAVHSELFELIALGVEHSLPADSMLDIAIGPLVQLWRIGFADARVPTPSEISEALARIDPSKIDLDEGKGQVFLRQPGMKLDLGAIAKGYIADRLVDYFREQEVTSAFINLGGNVLTYGHSPRQDDGRWRIGLRHPQHPDDQLAGYLSVAQQSVVTSGVYRRTLNRNGRSFHHILDPATGYPIETNVASLTIVSPQSVDGEIWTSRLFGRPAPDILAAIGAEPGLAAVVITDGLRVYASGDLGDQLVVGTT